VYEVGMLLHAVNRTANSTVMDQDRNAFVESFAVHARCLRDFLWCDHRAKPEDALASDFCAPGDWQKVRPELPRVVEELDDRNRIGREIVHLTYHRLDIAAETKDWNMSAIRDGIVNSFGVFAAVAEPDRLDAETKLALSDPEVIAPTAAPASIFSRVSGATQVTGPANITGGTIPFDGFAAGDVDADQC
jgi:hypothetical protein